MREKDGRLRFTLDNLYAGIIDVRVSQGNQSEIFRGDEYWTDPVPSLCVMYRYLKKREPFDFYEEGASIFAFEIGAYQNDTVVLQMDGDRTYRERLPVRYVEELFEKFFRDIREHPGFPYEFPCGCFGYDDDRMRLVDEAVERAGASYYGSSLRMPDKAEVKLHRKSCERFHVLNEEGRAYLEEYTRALYRQIPLSTWRPRRKAESDWCRRRPFLIGEAPQREA